MNRPPSRQNQFKMQPWGISILNGVNVQCKLRRPQISSMLPDLRALSSLQESSIILQQTPITFTVEEGVLREHEQALAQQKTQASTTSPVNGIHNNSMPLPNSTLPSTDESRKEAQQLPSASKLPNFPLPNGSILQPQPLLAPRKTTAVPPSTAAQHHKMFLDEFELKQDDPFENMELKTLNDLEELGHVLRSMPPPSANIAVSGSPGKGQIPTFPSSNSASATALKDIQFPHVTISEAQKSAVPQSLLPEVTDPLPRRLESPAPDTLLFDGAVLLDAALSMGFKRDWTLALLNAYSALYQLREEHKASLVNAPPGSVLQLPSTPLSIEQLISALITFQENFDPSLCLEEQSFCALLVEHTSNSLLRMTPLATLKSNFRETARALLNDAPAGTSLTSVRACLVLAEVEVPKARRFLSRSHATIP